MMTRMFEPQLGINIEVYIDDIVAKSKVKSEHIDDLGNIFGILRKYKFRLNVDKCSFGYALASFWVIWLPIVESKLTLIRLNQLTTCSLLGIPKRSRS